jgi:UDP-GlcNAc3NAcA epimerase
MNSTSHWISIVGARPQFIKIAPLVRAIKAYNQENPNQPIHHQIIHTGQHYDKGLSDVFFEELEIPTPDAHLGVGSASHGVQTGQMLMAIEEILLRDKPTAVIVFGDTNSTIAGALAASKLHLPIVHVEAGLRSLNRAMPEEINRILTDHASDLLLVPTETAGQHLAREGLADKMAWTGDIMYDTVLQNSEIASQKSKVLETYGLSPRGFGLVTLHRPANTDDPARLQGILEALNRISEEHFPLVFPMHPRTRNLLQKYQLDWEAGPNFHLIPPQGYLDLLQLLSHARMALTDSGGLQKEAFFLNCPCITMREETEWEETVSEKANVLTGSDPKKIWAAVQAWEERLLAGSVDFVEAAQRHFGKGNAAELVRDLILGWERERKE